MKVLTADGKETTDVDFATGNGFWFTFINQVKVGDVDGSSVPTNKSIDGIRDRCESDYFLNTRNKYRKWAEHNMLYVDESSLSIGEVSDRLLGDNAAKTSDNLDERIAKFNPQLRAGREYRIPLSHIDQFFKIDTTLDSNYQRQVVLILEKNANKLLESKKNRKLADIHDDAIYNSS